MINNTEEKYLAPIAIHPGETLLEEIEYLRISQNELAIRTGLTEKHISSIVNGKSSITPESALKFEKAIGLNAKGMLNLQVSYEETKARLEREKSLKNELEILGKFQETYAELKKIEMVKPLRWTKSKFTEIVQELQSFFGVNSLEYVQKTNLEAAYRKYQSGKINQNSVAAWLRLGQLKAQKTETDKFNSKLLKDNLDKIKFLSTKKYEEYLPQIENILASCGVVLVCAPYLKNTCTQGATQWIKKDKAFIILKTSKQGEDKFWFNLFHEIAHILKHGSSKTFIDLEDKSNTPEEREADLFAQKNLLPGFNLQNKDLRNISPRELKKIAKEFSISPSIVAGRLGYESKNYSYYNKFVEPIDYQNIDSLS